MKLWKRILSCFLALLLTVYLLPVQVMAEELGDLWPLTTENIAETPPDVIGEVLERREENQKEFLLANGVRQVVIYPAAVHYQKDGQWKDIDNRLLPATTRDGETVYQNVAGMWDVSVPAELNTARGITVSRNGYSLSFYLTGQLFEDGGAISESGSASMGEELPGEDNKAYGLGYGWRTNYNQRVEQITLGGTTYYRWEDEDGTRHYFMKKSAGLYVDELEPTRQLTDTGSGTKKFCITEKSGSKRYFDASGRLAVLSNNQATASSVSIYYASQDHISVISDGVGRKYRFSYDSSGNLTKISFTGTGTTELSAMTYQVSGDNLRTIGYPDGKNATFSYGAEHLLTGAQDADGYKLAYTYNTTTNGQPNRIATIKEYDGSTAGGTLSLEYAHNQTTFTDHNGNKEIMQFNRYGSTLSVQDGLGRAQFSQYANSTDLAKASQLTLSSKLQNTVINLLESGSLESKTGWTVSGTGTGSWSYSQAQAYYGRTSLSIQNNTLKPVSSAVQALEPGKTYTFSAYVRAGASGARIGLLKPGSTEPLVVSTAAPANNTWTRLQVTYTLPSGSAYASVLPFLQNTSGTAAYFDALQLEQTASPSRYNLVENSDFSFNSAWTPNSSCASTDQIITYTSSPTENSDKRVMRITGDPNKHKYGNQILSGLGGAAGDVYTVAGWAKGDCVYTDDSNRRMYALMVRFYYTDGTTSDNFIKFNPDTDSQSSWQFVSGVVKAAKPYSQMGIYTAYVQTLNTVYFDNVQLFKEEFGHSYDYDSNGNLISVVDLQKNKTKYDYDSNNNLVKMTLPSGASQSYTYDSYHNVIKAVSPEGVTSRFTYDTYGNIKTVKLGSGSQTISASAVYTANGDQVSSVTDALGQTTTYGYDTQTGVLNWTQAPGETASTRTNYTHDQLYRTIKVQQSTAAVDYTYSKDLLSAISTASGTDYSFTYGVFDLTTAVKAGSRTLISHSYTNDQNRRLSRSVYGNGDAVSYSYDSFGRTTAVTYGDTGSTVSYAYDANSNLGQLTDGISGRVNRYSYDFLDRLMRYEESGDGYSNIVQWGYDDENNLSSQTQTLNGTTYTSTYAYDKDNRLTKATEGTISANYTYDSFSRMTGLTSKNGSTSVVNTAVTYVDPSSSATSTQVKTWNNGKAAYTYTYDSKGNITSITGGGQEFEYRYDKYGRLISAEDYPGGYVWTYTYDDGGNITQRGLTDYYNNKNPNSILATYTYGNADWPDLLTAFNGKSITYDAIGNPLSDGTWTYAWQHGRQLASMSKSGSSITYGYNADGKRISKTANGTTYSYSYLGDQLTEMTWGSNKLHFTYDSIGPASVTYNGVKYFYLKNAQGDVTGLVNASGTQVVSYAYDPWGAPMSTSGTMASTLGAANPLRYRGYVYDTETSLYYLSSRYYNPVWGRFINADTVAVVAASPDKANWDKNLFAYCDNDPVNRKDDGGEFWHIIAAGAINGAISAINNAVTQIREKGSDNFDWGQVFIAAAFGCANGVLTSCGVFSFGAVIALSGVLGAAESVASDLRSNYTGEQNYSTGQIIGHAIVNASTAACLAWASGPSDGSKMNDLYKDSKAGKNHLRTPGTSPTGNRAAQQSISAYKKALVRFSKNEGVSGVGNAISGKLIGYICRSFR